MGTKVISTKVYESDSFVRSPLKILDEGVGKALGTAAGWLATKAQRGLGKVLDTKAERERQLFDAAKLRQQKLAQAGSDPVVSNYINREYGKKVKAARARAEGPNRYVAGLSDALKGFKAQRQRLDTQAPGEADPDRLYPRTPVTPDEAPATAKSKLPISVQGKVTSRPEKLDVGNPPVNPEAAYAAAKAHATSQAPKFAGADLAKLKSASQKVRKGADPSTNFKPGGAPSKVNPQMLGAVTNQAIAKLRGIRKSDAEDMAYLEPSLNKIGLFSKKPTKVVAQAPEAQSKPAKMGLQVSGSASQSGSQIGQGSLKAHNLGKALSKLKALQPKPKPARKIVGPFSARP